MKTLRHLAATRIPLGTVLDERENVVVGNVLFEMKRDAADAHRDLEVAEVRLESTLYDLSRLIKTNICGDSHDMSMAMTELLDLYESIHYWRYEITHRGDVDYGFGEMEVIIQSCIVRPPAYINRTELANVVRGVLSSWDDGYMNMIDHTTLNESHLILHGFIMDYITLIRRTHESFCNENHVRRDLISRFSRQTHMDRIMRNMKIHIVDTMCDDISEVACMVRADVPDGCVATLRYRCTACGEYYDGEICCPDMVHMPITDYEPA